MLAVAVALGAVAVQRTESRLRASGREAPATVTAVVPAKSGYNVDVRDPLSFTGATIFLAALSATLTAASILFFVLLRRRR